MANWEFDWDDANRGHIARHKVRPEEIEEVFGRVAFTVPTDPGPDGEQRIKIHGTSAAGRFLTVLYTSRVKKLRPVTAYDMSRKDRKLYAEEIRKAQQQQDSKL